jgi:hypothetical protein
MKGTRLDAVSSIQHTVTRELKAIRKAASSRTFDFLHEGCKRAETILNDGINTHVSFCVFL